ncbi:MAG: hypothetical protein WBM98_02955 [Maribacter sp.]|uniref:hypothetical protein n=1 Tax=Maribacter sp. TaxID=1897614 RepID=UPI003C70675E
MKPSHTYNSLTPSESDNELLVTRLKRNLKDVYQLRHKLDSYRCEPRTYLLFERIESLKKGLETLECEDLEIISELKEHEKSDKEYAEKIIHQYSEFNDLQQGVKEYIFACETHHRL